MGKTSRRSEKRAAGYRDTGGCCFDLTDWVWCIDRIHTKECVHATRRTKERPDGSGDGDADDGRVRTGTDR